MAPPRSSLSRTPATPAPAGEGDAPLDDAPLVEAIAAARATLAAWVEQRTRHAQAWTRSVAPLLRQYLALRRDEALRLDRLLDDPGWHRAERATLTRLLHEALDELRHATDEDAEAIEALQRRHGDPVPTHDTATADPGSDAAHADDEPWAAAAAQARAHAEAHARARAQRRRTPAAAAEAPVAAVATTTLRNIFRRLASALHPDRERDPARREAKTALMQQANRAYEGRDLLTLLELQGAAGTAPPATPAGLDPAQRAARTRLLEARLRDLRDEIDRVEAEVRADLGLPPGRGMNPAKLNLTVRDEARALREAIAHQIVQLRLLDDAVALRPWLREARRQQRGLDAAGAGAEHD
ncbi:MAG: J domain-containing protein [Burkholderiaceae bacterium]